MTFMSCNLYKSTCRYSIVKVHQGCTLSHPNSTSLTVVSCTMIKFYLTISILAIDWLSWILYKLRPPVHNLKKTTVPNWEQLFIRFTSICTCVTENFQFINPYSKILNYSLLNKNFVPIDISYKRSMQLLSLIL